MVTLNNPTVEDRLRVRTLPHIVKYHCGQDEIGDEGTLHIQSYVYSDYIRRSALSKWLPRAHFEKAIKPQAVANYVKKTATSVEDSQFAYGTPPSEKVDDTVGQITMMDNLTRLCKYIKPEDIVHPVSTIDELAPKTSVRQDVEKEYWRLVGRAILENPDLIGIYTMPNLRTAWINLSGTIKEINGRTDSPAIISPGNCITNAPCSPQSCQACEEYETYQTKHPCEEHQCD